MSEQQGRGCGCMGCVSSMVGIVFSVVLTAGILAVVEMSHAGADAAAIEAASKCDAVTSALGSPIEEAPMSFGCGEYNGGTNSATASFTIQVKGPKGRGSLTYHGSKRGGAWTINAATMEAGGKSIQVVPCGGGGGPGPTPRPKRRRPGRR